MRQDKQIPYLLMTVLGPIEPDDAGITDAHNHLFIAPVPDSASDSPVLENQMVIGAELLDFVRAGGKTIVDCQPGGCGRDCRALHRLARSCGVNILASTGFHLTRYYPTDYWLFRASIEEARAYFLSELKQSVYETRGSHEIVRANLIKIACEETVEKSAIALMEAAAIVSRDEDVAIQIHTEKGADAEQIVQPMTKFGSDPARLVLCHMDKRPDFELHYDLAQMGILLEYDTFFRPKYKPEENVWPLLGRMVDANLDSKIAIATDMADLAMWLNLGGDLGLTGLFTHIIPRLQDIGFTANTIAKLVGENITTCLRRPLQQPALS